MDDLTVDKAIQICQTAEANDLQIQSLAPTVNRDANVNYATPGGDTNKRILPKIR